MAVTYADVREWVLALPGTREVYVERWDEHTLRCGDKMIVGGGSSSGSISVKATVEEQAELVAGAPETYSVAAYVGRYGWVRVELKKARAAELRRVVEDAWRRTAPKKVVRAYDAARG
jgi:hypothetical protein